MAKLTYVEISEQLSKIKAMIKDTPYMAMTEIDKLKTAMGGDEAMGSTETNTLADGKTGGSVSLY